MTLPLTLACGPYDRTLPLALRQVQPEGIDLTYLVLRPHPEAIFWRMSRHREFDASEMSLSSYVVRRSRGDDSLQAIPVFPSKFFRHGSIFVNARSGIERPEDLKGKRMGVPEYQMTAAVWVRAFLDEDYGVGPSDMRWFQGGIEQSGRVEKVEIRIPGVEITPIAEHQTLSNMLAEGELDVLMAAGAPSSFDGQRVRRLFPDHRAVEADYFRRTGIFPIMHTVVIRREVLDEHPWVARNLYDAFCAAKVLVMADLDSSARALVTSLPWQMAELESTRDLMGNDFWAYGLEPNRRTLEALVRYSHAQGLAARLVPVEELFVPSTLDEPRL